jgi:hypothetical protein
MELQTAMCSICSGTILTWQLNIPTKADNEKSSKYVFSSLAVFTRGRLFKEFGLILRPNPKSLTGG